MAAMIDLDNFRKLGARLPKRVRDWVKSQVSTLEGRVDYLDGDITQEGLMGVALVHLMSMSDQERLELVRLRAPELLAMFEAESPGGGRAGAAGDQPAKPMIEEEIRVPRPRKRGTA